MWGDAARPADSGDVIRGGGAFLVERGFVTVAVGRGVTVDLVGPVKAVVEDAGTVRLRSGLLAAEVTEAGHGFRVVTEDADVLDLGTAFLVKKDFGSGTQVRVTAGRVEAALVDEAGRTVKVLDLV